MRAIILVIHMLIGTSLVGVILLQRSEGGIGLGGGNFGGLMTGRGSANLLTRSTGFLAGAFLATSLLLAVLAGQWSKQGSILDQPVSTAPVAPQPSGPAAPVAN